MTADKDHQAVFGHLVGEHFTATEAAEYLEIPESALQTLTTAGRLHPIGDGRFPVSELKALKQASRRSRDADADEDRRIDAVATERVATFDPAKAITHENMLRKFRVPSENSHKDDLSGTD